MDTLGGPIMLDDGMGGLIAINAISGVGINDAGNVGFAATWDTGEVDPDTGDPILESAAYFYDAATASLHQVLREGDVIGTPPWAANRGRPHPTGGQRLLLRTQPGQ